MAKKTVFFHLEEHAYEAEIEYSRRMCRANLCSGCGRSDDVVSVSVDRVAIRCGDIEIQENDPRYSALRAAAVAAFEATDVYGEARTGMGPL